MAEAEGESLESWLSEYPGPRRPDPQPRASLLSPPSPRHPLRVGGLRPAAVRAQRRPPASIPRSHPGASSGPSPPAARPQAPACDTCSSRPCRPGKRHRVLRADGRARWGGWGGTAPSLGSKGRERSGFGPAASGLSPWSQDAWSEICFPKRYYREQSTTQLAK